MRKKRREGLVCISKHQCSLQDKRSAEMEETSGKMHRLADTTYRNNEELSAELHRLATAARTYYKAMQGLELASRQFHGVLGSIANKAANLPGGVRKLGDAAEDLVTGYHHVENQFRGLMHSMNTDFIVPLETKLEAEEKNLTDMHKIYRQEHGKRESLLSKTKDQIRSLKKKKHLTNTQQEKLAQLKQIEGDQMECLHQTRVEGLRKALLEERKLYCFVLDHLTSVIRNEVAYNATSHEELSTRLNGLRTITSYPNELPEESATLLIDPHSPRAFSPSPDNDMPDTSEAPIQAEPPTIMRVKAIHPHNPMDSGQLEFKIGDVIDAEEESQQNGWQFGTNLHTGGTGWFPMHFVSRIEGLASPTHQWEQNVGEMSSASPPQPPRDYVMTSPPPLPEKDY